MRFAMIVSSVSTPSGAASGLAAARRPHPLLTTARWELRRLGSARSTWISALLVFVLACLVEVALSTNPDSATLSSDSGPRTVMVDWLSNYGLFHTLPTFLGMILALFIPFLCADGVALDLKRRTHELLMTTAVPSWAYVWARYLSSLLISLGLACVMLLGIIAAALGMRQFQPDVVLPLDLPGIILLWAALFLPPVLILSGISFGLGTLWPRLSLLIKLAVLLLWFLDRPIISKLSSGDALDVWDPTSQAVAATPSTGVVINHLAQQTQHMSTSLFLVQFHALEQQLPDMSTWIIPRLAWIGLGMACVVLATLCFRRFRDMRG